MKNNSPEGVTGNCLVHCDQCGKSFVMNFTKPKKSIVCRDCGHEILLTDVRLIYQRCECGNQLRLLTNSKEPEIWSRCRRCRAVLEAKWNEATHRYETKKKEKVVTYNMTPEQLDQIKADAAHNAIETLLDLTFGLPAMVLMDKLRFGKVRLERFTSDVWKLYEEYEEGRLTLDDIKKTLWEEGGIKIEKVRKR